MSNRSRTPLVIAAVAAVVAIIAVAAVIVAGGGDDDEGEAAELAPALRGEDYEGNPVTVVPGEDGPLMIVFLAHWCPHCNAEIPVLQQWDASGAIPEDLSIVGVSTAAEPGAPNYPPGEWLVDMGWGWPVLADDDDGTFAELYGVTGFPYMVFVDEDGNITGTVSGEQPIEELQTLAEQAVA